MTKQYFLSVVRPLLFSSKEILLAKWHAIALVEKRPVDTGERLMKKRWQSFILFFVQKPAYVLRNALKTS